MAISTNEILDVAIVGGGVSGVYCAWRLINAMPTNTAGGTPQIGLFEGSKRIGGRLLSVTPPGMPHVACELGGMRYMSTHTLVRSLVENKLKLATESLPVDKPENIAYLRGKHLRLSQLTDATQAPYNLDWAERGQNPGNLLNDAINQLIPGVTKLYGDALLQMLQNYVFDGQHIYDWGFWNLLARALSSEAYNLSRDSGGYDTVVLNWNAADTIRLNQDFVPGVTFKRLVQGYEEVPLTLAQQFKKAGGTIHMRTRLKSFDTAQLPDGTTGVKLILHPRNNGWDSLEDAKCETVYARALILAMPRRSLEMLDQTGAVLHPTNAAQRNHVRGLIGSVTPIPLFKLFVCYPYPWWESVGVTQGRSVTDLPIRQCYYWGVEGEQPGANAANRNAVILASYDDTLNVDFWDALQGTAADPLFTPQPNPHRDSQPGSPDWDDYRAPAAMVREAQRQHMEMHGVRFAPEPYDAAFMDWGIDPYGGGVNFWNIHAKSWDVIPQIAQPVPTAPVYICGEAYSNGQGWVEGALETAEIVLQQHLHLAPPDWVTPNQAA